MNVTSLMTALLICLTPFAAQAGEHFSVKPYLKKCGGGKVYPKCDSPSLNQNTIFEAGRAEALKKNIDIMLVVGADWCAPCLEFDALIYKDKDSAKLFEKVVLIDINGDVESGKALLKRLQISSAGYPQAFILKAKTNDWVQKFFPGRFANVAELVSNFGRNVAEYTEPQGEKPLTYDKVDVSTLELPVELNGDYGLSTFYPSPKNDSEKFINQGVAALQVYHYVDAYRAFRMAELMNADSVMPHVGRIFSLINIDEDSADSYLVREAFQKISVIQKKRTLTPAEKTWVNFARAMHAENVANYVKAEGVEVTSMTDALKNINDNDPQNVDGLSLATWFTVGQIGMAQSKTVFKAILAIQPDNIGAHHSLMHIAESENDAAEANVHAPILAQLAPRSAHALHMVGHTLPQQGRWAEALAYFKKADAIHNEWAQKNGVKASQDWHYTHNLNLMAASYLGLGDTKKAMSTWIIGVNEADYTLLSHIIDLAVATDHPSAQGLIKVLEDSGGATNLEPRRREVDLTPEKAKDLAMAATPPRDDKRSDYTKLLDRVIADYAKKSGADSALTSDIGAYFSGKFKESGFDGWSNSYLELLRLKRVAKILSLTWLSESLDSLEFAVQSGSLCSPVKK